MKTQHLWILLSILLIHQRVLAQLKVGDQPTIVNKSVALDVQGSNGKQGLWLPRVTDTSITGIRALNPPDGLVIYHSPSGHLLLRSNSSWLNYLTNALTTLSAGGQSLAGPTVTLQTGTSAGAGNDVNIAGNSATNTATINIPDASSTVRGVVTTGSQSLAGLKTFANGVVVSSGGVTVNGGVASIAGATGSTSNLTLGITSATATSTTTNTNLTVDNAGKVILAQNYVTAPAAVNIRTFTAIPGGLPVTIAQASYTTFTFTFPAGTNLKTTSTVTMSPTTSLAGGCGLGWARVTSATQIQASYFSGYSAQTFAAGYAFYITVVEF
jgi:hypothetical protein